MKTKPPSLLPLTILFECVRIWPPQLIGHWPKGLLKPPPLSTFTVLAKLQLHPPPSRLWPFQYTRRPLIMGDSTPIILGYYVKCSLCLTQHPSFITLLLIAPGKMNFVLGLLPLSVRWGMYNHSGKDLGIVDIFGNMGFLPHLRENSITLVFHVCLSYSIHSLRSRAITFMFIC